MPRIPIQYNQGRLQGGSNVAAMVDPGAFSHGAEVRYRLADDFWKQFEAMQKTKDYIYTLQAVTEAEGKARDLYTEGMLNAKPGAEGFTKDFNGKLDEQLNKMLEAAPSTQSRTMLYEQMANMRRGYLNHASQFEHSSRIENLQNSAIETVNGRVNSMIRNGGDATSIFNEIDTVVDQMGGALGANRVDDFKRQLKQQSAYGLLSGAITQDKPKMGAEIMSGKYDQYLTPAQMSHLVKISKAKGRQKATIDLTGRTSNFKEAYKSFSESIANGD
jgi:hypothetical protein